MKENYFLTFWNFTYLKDTSFGKKSCNFEHGLETKNEFEKWPLITFFQCIICTMDDVWGDFLGPPHGTTLAAVIANKMILRSFKSSEHINEKGDGPYRGFGYFFSDPIDFATWSQRELL